MMERFDINVIAIIWQMLDMSNNGGQQLLNLFMECKYSKASTIKPQQSPLDFKPYASFQIALHLLKKVSFHIYIPWQ